jgi:hypothetical protein
MLSKKSKYRSSQKFLQMKYFAIFETEPLPNSLLGIAGEFVAFLAAHPAARDKISSLVLQILGGLPNFSFSTASAKRRHSSKHSICRLRADVVAEVI